ncbi:rRNA maturation RNase YbeY [Patescibacteria group bacterium]|nr:rRNA maturation RNase YbeY [Patescibacteria group bacterium]
MIGINNLTTTSVNEEFLQKIVRKVLKGEGVKGEMELSIALVESARIRELNKRYLGKDKVTDVLAFGEKYEVGSTEKEKGIKSPGPFIELGEVIICPQQVKKNAKKFGSTFEKELAKILIHGILHLLSYNHEKSRAEAKKMEKKEQNYLSRVLDSKF